MMGILLFLLLLSSGSVFCGVYFGKRYEETLPLTVFAVVEFVFLFGLLDRLRLGVWLCCAAAVVLYAASAWRLYRRRTWREAASNLLTPAFVMFLALLAVYAVCARGMKLTNIDEYSFWAVSVKKMYTMDALPCAAEAMLEHSEYPPGMSVFYLILQVLNGAYTEWLLYFGKMVYIFALFMPFLKGLRHRAVALNTVVMAAVFACGTVFYRMVYNQLAVDFLLGLTYAYGMAMLASAPARRGRCDGFAVTHIILTANMLVLIKSAGKLFAILLLAGLLLCAGPGWFKDLRRGKTRKRAALGCGAWLLPFVTMELWKLKYTRAAGHIAFDTGKYDLGEMASILLGRTDGGYRSEVLRNFINFIAEEKWEAGVLSLTNPQWWLVLCALLCLAWYAYQRGGVRLRTPAACLLVGGLPVYVFGLLASYMYTFVDYEAVSLASMQRYLNIYYTGILMTALFLLLAAAARFRWDDRLVCAACLAFLCCTSHPHIFGILTRLDVRTSLAVRAPQEQSAEHIREGLAAVPVTEPGQVVLVVDQEADWQLQTFYLLWPEYRVLWTGSFGSQPRYEGDVYTEILDPEGFRAYVSDNQADYILMENVSGDFRETYEGLFPVPLENGQVFAVSDGQFRLVETAP